MSLWKAHNEPGQEPDLITFKEYEIELRQEIAAAIQAGETVKGAGQCVWPACGHGQAHGDYCLYHYDLLVGAECIEDKEYTERMDEIIKTARVKVAAMYPNNTYFKKWDDD